MLLTKLMLLCHIIATDFLSSLLLPFNPKTTTSTMLNLTKGSPPMRCIRVCLLLSAALCAMPAMALEKSSQPKLVVVLVVDGLPQEQVQRYRDQFGQGGFRRLLDQGAWFSNAHQAHGVTVTCVGHAAILTGAYPYRHGIIANNWIDPATQSSVYCSDDTRFTYIGEETKALDGTSPSRLQVTTVGDELRYASGNQSKVVTVSGKDRGAIMLAGKSGTAYMYMGKTGNFASSTYYMQSHPEWVKKFQATKPQDQFYNKEWRPLLPDAAYTNDAKDELVANKPGPMSRFPFTYTSASGKPDSSYYASLTVGPYLDGLTLDFARAAVEGEQLGQNPAGVTDVLGVSLSSHDYVNHSFGPESRMSHDHLQRLDRQLGDFLTYLDKRIGLNNIVVILTADHGFPNTAEFAQANKIDAQRIDGGKMIAALNKHLAEKFGIEKIALKFSAPGITLDVKAIEQKGIKRDEVEAVAARFLLAYPAIERVYTRSQLENGAIPANRIDQLMQRAWHRQISPDILVVPKAYSIFGYGDSGGTTHGSPFVYDTNVPLMIMGSRWIKPGAYASYAEVMDIAPTLAHLLRVRPPSGSEGRILQELLK